MAHSSSLLIPITQSTSDLTDISDNYIYNNSDIEFQNDQVIAQNDKTTLTTTTTQATKFDSAESIKNVLMMYNRCTFDSKYLLNSS